MTSEIADTAWPFSIRSATPSDAEGILRAHYSAVHQTAAKDYSHQVLAAWSPVVDEARIAKRRAKMETDRTIISYVAVDGIGHILGFCELVPPETLGALYVAAWAGRNGVASALLSTLESRARQIGMRVLSMESSVTAVPFYRKHGFREVEPSLHPFSSDLVMRCVKMHKLL